MERTTKLEEELLRLMPVRQQGHESVAGPFACRWCDVIVKLANGSPFPGEAHDPDCFAGRYLKRPVRAVMPGGREP
jgi:hypothetical protein